MIDWSEGLPLKIGPILVGWTETSPETAEFWRGVTRRELMIKHCQQCARYLHPRRVLCPECRIGELGWQRSQGTGKVYSFSTIYRAPTPEFETPYTNGIVCLNEGVYLFGRLVGKDPDEYRIDDEVEVEFAPIGPGDNLLPVYRVQ
jgi:uncharacterized OB-fold protein